MKKYEQYKSTGISWLGEIPENWEIDRLGRHFTERNNKVSDKDYPPLSVTKKGIVPQLEGVAKTKDRDNRKLVKAGDFVINSRSDRKGSSGLAPLDGSVSLINIVLTPQDVDGRWCNYLFRSHPFIEEYYRNGRGIVADLWTTRYSEMRGIFIPIPPRPEQEQIVRFLDWKVNEINHFIRKKKDEIKLLTNLRRSLITRAVTGGLDYTGETINVPFWGEAVPAHWEERRFRSLFSLSKGLGITKANLQDTGIPCVSYGEVHSKYGFEVIPEIHALRCVNETYLQSSPKSLLQYGDFVFADTSEDLEGSGNFTYLNSTTQIFAGYHTIIARALEPINYRYMAYAFDSLAFRVQIRRRVNAVKVYSITRGILNGTHLMLPSPKEQQEIVDYLDEKCKNIDKFISSIKQEISLITEYRTRLVSDVVTGKIDVRHIDVPTYKLENYAEPGNDYEENEEELDDTDEMEVIENVSN